MSTSSNMFKTNWQQYPLKEYFKGILKRVDPFKGQPFLLNGYCCQSSSNMKKYFPQKCPSIIGCFAENDLQEKASYGCCHPVADFGECLPLHKIEAFGVDRDLLWRRGTLVLSAP